jgi:hypothetical protein
LLAINALLPARRTTAQCLRLFGTATIVFLLHPMRLITSVSFLRFTRYCCRNNLLRKELP